jgi:hypothetical protein
MSQEYDNELRGVLFKNDRKQNDAPKWQPIETAPKFPDRTMFVVRAFSVQPSAFSDSRVYTSDPWCVWRERDGGFARWPHVFQPTHWMPLPAPPDAAIAAAPTQEN